MLLARTSHTRGHTNCKGITCFRLQLSLLVRLLISLTQVRTMQPIYTICDLHAPSISTMVKQLGSTVLRMPSGAPTPSWARSLHVPTFYKLRLLKLTQFEKLLFLDNDVIVQKNVDALLSDVPAPAMVFQAIAQGLNSGVMLLRPDAQLAQRAEQLLLSPHNRTRDGGDQEVWELLWVGAEVHELPITYNARVYLRIVETDWVPRAAIVHTVDRWWNSTLAAPAWQAIGQFCRGINTSAGAAIISGQLSLPESKISTEHDMTASEWLAGCAKFLDSHLFRTSQLVSGIR